MLWMYRSLGDDETGFRQVSLLSWAPRANRLRSLHHFAIRETGKSIEQWVV